MTEMTFSLTDCEKEEVGGGGRLWKEDNGMQAEAI